MGSRPTPETYAELERAYEYFNEHLFGGRLHSCLITLQRQHDTFGYFSPNQFTSRNGEIAHEIALNPSYFAVRPIPETLSILVREMVTLDLRLHSTSKPPRRRYRNKEWADAVEAIGLMPSDTGIPGGRRTGDNVQTYIVAGGKFDDICNKLVDEAFTFSWLDRFPPDIPELEVEMSTDYPDILGDEDAFLMSSDETVGEGASRPAVSPMASLKAVSEMNPLLGIEQPGAIETHVSESPEIENSPPADGVDPAAPAPAPVSAPVAVPPMRRYEPIASDVLRELGVEPRERVKNMSKTRYQCGVCNARAWGKPGLRIGCLGNEQEPHDSQLMVAGE